MTNSDLAALQAWLAANLTGETVTIGPIPASPDRCLSIMDYPGPQTPNWQADYRLQIRCRGARPGPGVSPYQSAHALADAVIALVAPPQDNDLIVTLAGGHRATVQLLGDGALPMGPDDLGRQELSINIALQTSRV